MKLAPDAFSFYAGLGAKRSYRLVADHYGVSKRTVVNRAEEEGWQTRVEEFDAKASKDAERRMLESLEEMNIRHLKSLRAIQAKALEALRSVSLEKAIDAVRALELGIRQERLIRGEPSERTAVSVEETIRNEYQRWLVKDDSEEANDED